MQNEAIERVDVVVIGAGLSGIGSAWHLMHRCPDRSFVILESRHAIGGTWDLFRFPRQGDRNPWRNTQDYGEDRKIVKHAPLHDGALELSNSHGMSGAFGRRPGDLVQTV